MERHSTWFFESKNTNTKCINHFRVLHYALQPSNLVLNRARSTASLVPYSRSLPHRTVPYRTVPYLQGTTNSDSLKLLFQVIRRIAKNLSLLVLPRIHIFNAPCHYTKTTNTTNITAIYKNHTVLMITNIHTNLPTDPYCSLNSFSPPQCWHSLVQLMALARVLFCVCLTVATVSN
jgi:hypothetical protein